MRQSMVDNTRYNVVLYGFKVNTDLSANMSHMFLNIIQMKRNIRHAWIDSYGQSQFVIISENNRPLPSNLLSQLLWSEDITHPNTTNLTPIKQTVTFVESKLPDKCGPNLEVELADSEENHYINDIVVKELRNDLMYPQTKEREKYTRWLLNSILRRHNKEEQDALQIAQHDYLVNWARKKEESSTRHINV